MILNQIKNFLKNHSYYLYYFYYFNKKKLFKLRIIVKYIFA